MNFSFGHGELEHAVTWLVYYYHEPHSCLCFMHPRSEIKPGVIDAACMILDSILSMKAHWHRCFSFVKSMPGGLALQALKGCTDTSYQWQSEHVRRIHTHACRLGAGTILLAPCVLLFLFCPSTVNSHLSSVICPPGEL